MGTSFNIYPIMIDNIKTYRYTRDFLIADDYQSLYDLSSYIFNMKRKKKNEKQHRMMLKALNNPKEFFKKYKRKEDRNIKRRKKDHQLGEMNVVEFVDNKNGYHNCVGLSTLKIYDKNWQMIQKKVYIRQHEFFSFLYDITKSDVEWLYEEYQGIQIGLKKISYQLRLYILEFYDIMDYNYGQWKEIYGYFKDDKYKKIYPIFVNIKIMNEKKVRNRRKDQKYCIPLKYINLIEFNNMIYNCTTIPKSVESILLMSSNDSKPFSMMVLTNEKKKWLMRMLKESKENIKSFQTNLIVDDHDLIDFCKVLHNVKICFKEEYRVNRFCKDNTNSILKIIVINQHLSLKELKNNDRLKCLDVSNNSLDDDFINSISNMSSLVSLNISYTDCSIADFVLLFKQTKIQRLKFLVNDNTELNIDNLEVVEFQNSSLIQIDVSGFIPNSNFFKLLQKCVKIESLVLYTSNLPKRVFEDISNVHNLQYLSTCNMFKHDIVMKQITRLTIKIDNSLRQVEVRNCYVYDTPIEMVCKFEKYDKLEYLEISDSYKHGNNGQQEIQFKYIFGENFIENVKNSSIQKVVFNDVWMKDCKTFELFKNTCSKVVSFEFRTDEKKDYRNKSFIWKRF